MTTSIEQPLSGDLPLKTLSRALVELNTSIRKRYAIQLDVSHADEMSDSELKRFVSGKSFLLMGTENEINLLVERLQGLGIDYR